MRFVLVSACLLGSPVRYNGSHQLSGSGVLQRWLSEGRVIAVCPEVSGGFPVPRPPAEIAGGAGGAKVLAGLAKVFDPYANDISNAFVNGARNALQHVQLNSVRLAVLKEGSPSCGSSYIYDGSFTGVKVPEMGVTAALLVSYGVNVFSEEQFEEADAFLRELETSGSA